ncbi:MAG: hypothetical protein ACI4J1_11195 [Ruminiclostridium sp.]
MNVFDTMTVFDYIILSVGILSVILGIVQLCVKRCIGIMKIDRYTEESAGKFTRISSVIYILGGIITAAAPLVVNYINLNNYGFSLSTTLPRWILYAVVAVLIIAQFIILKKKD